MTVEAAVVFVRDGKEIWNRGVFEFLQIPAKGDRFTIKQYGGVSNPDGAEDVFEVVYVEHFPVRQGEAPTEEPSAKIIVEWITGLHG